MQQSLIAERAYAISLPMLAKVYPTLPHAGISKSIMNFVAAAAARYFNMTLAKFSAIQEKNDVNDVLSTIRRRQRKDSVAFPIELPAAICVPIIGRHHAGVF